VAIDAGAEMLGFNFYAMSPRFMSPEAAREIVRSVQNNVECVGVFVNEPAPDDVLAIVNHVGLATAQLHGDESPDYCAEVARGCGVIKALRVGRSFDPAIAAQFGSRILLDAATAHFGGSGRSFDWRVAAQVREHASELILAGGLHPGNVGEAIEIAAPHVVDVCSGVESSPRVKDRQKMMAFMDALRAADERRRAKVQSA
jgi:phosphoribosylanthranilate isomerase